MTFPIVLLLILIGSIVFQFVSPWQQTPLASNWGSIDTTLMITAVICGIFFVAIILFMVYVLIKYRHKEGSKAAYEPDSSKLEFWLVVATTVGICALLAPGLVVYNDFVHVPEDAHDVEVVGQQWMWTFRYPGADGKLGAADVKHMGVDNSFGVDPDDPAGQDDILIASNEIKLPIDKPVQLLLRSKDVLHDFYVPQFRVKMDMVPGLVSYMWLTPTKLGTFEILCAELCGVGHYNMRGLVEVVNQADYDAWLAQQTTFAQSLVQASSGGIIGQGKQLAQSQGCLACHSVDGGKSIGPGWQGLYGKTETLIDGSQVEVDAAYLRESITAANAKLVEGYPPVMASYDLSTEQLDALVAYIQSISGEE